MKFLKYIKEARDNYKVIIEKIETLDDAAEMLKILKKDCSQFLNIVKSTQSMIYRGTRRGADFVLDFPRENRKPKDTPQVYHEALDEIFEEIYGWKVRSGAVFTTASYTSADYYGEVYIFFPKNGFEYVWSPNIKDLFVELKNKGFFMGKPDKNSLKDMYYDLYGEGQEGGGDWEYEISRDRGKRIRKSGEFTYDDVFEIAKKWVDKYVLKNNMFRYTNQEKQEMYKKQTKKILALADERNWKPYKDFDEFTEDYYQEYEDDEYVSDDDYEYVSDDDYESIKEIITKSYKDNDIETAITTDHEVSFKCDSFYLLRYATYIKNKDDNNIRIDTYIKNNLE